MAKIIKWCCLSLFVVLEMAALLSGYCYFKNLDLNLLPKFVGWEEVKIQLRSTDLVAHQVYLDRRPGFVWLSNSKLPYSNASVISISVHKNYQEAIIGCEIDGVEINKTKTEDLEIRPYLQRFFSLTHRDCYLYCFDVDIQEYSKVSVLYLKNGTVIKETVQSDLVVIPPKNVTEEDEVMVCATGFGIVPHLDQWLTYQKTLGIKFVHINIDPSFLQNVDKSSTLKKFVTSGFVKMISWDNCLNSSQVFYYSQALKYHDCALRYQGLFKYMMVIDFDEYFVPYNSGKSVLFYAKTFLKKSVGSLFLPRQTYFKKSRNFEMSPLPSDGNMTKLYNTTTAYQLETQGKSIHLVKFIKQNSVHTALLLPPYRRLNLIKPLKFMCGYVAHLRGQS